MTQTGYLKQTFEARRYPEAIWFGEECVAGPFCAHCGNPFSMHGPDLRCPNRHLHPCFPSPNLPFEDEAGVSLAAREILRRLRALPPGSLTRRRRASTWPRRLVDELLTAGYVRETNGWIEPT